LKIVGNSPWGPEKGPKKFFEKMKNFERMRFSEYSYGRPCSGFVPPWSLVVLHNSVAVLAARRAILKWRGEPVVKSLDITLKKKVRNELETSRKK